jgi:competence protein ComEA
MQAKLRSELTRIVSAAASLSRLQLFALFALALMLAVGATTAYIRSRPRPVKVSATEATAPAIKTRTITVHVAGAVARPGLYDLPESSRVADVIERAGGASQDAVIDDLNLAARLADGQKVMVPRTSPAGSAPAGATSPPAEGGLININAATAEELDKLPGVGPAMAAKIVEYRKKNGPYTSVDDLDNVPGIGPSKLESVRDLVAI